jgi:hypothetical protein
MPGATGAGVTGGFWVSVMTFLDKGIGHRSGGY